MAGTRVARAATGGIAVGAMLAIVGFQLTAHLRQDDAKKDAPNEAPLAALHEPEAEPVAWLAERPKLTKGGAPGHAQKGGDHAKPSHNHDALRDGGPNPRRHADGGDDGGTRRGL